MESTTASRPGAVMAIILVALPLVVMLAFGHLLVEASKDEPAAWPHWPAG